RERFISNNNDAVSSPVFHQNFLLIGGLMFKLEPRKPAASVLWPDTKALSRAILSHTSTAIIQGGCVFSAKSSGEFVCLEASTGKQLWMSDKVTGLKRGASIHLTPHGDFVFLYTDKGELIRAKLTPEGYQEMGRARVLEPVYPFAGRKVAWSAPGYGKRQIFGRNEKELVCTPLDATK